eukprot:Tamp_17387.p2 GENE.Tamp_17387~~Tamp_17387.p2  ORF type:complete len:182 (-),score=45.46 Tamp_17387:847-1362(-)
MADSGAGGEKGAVSASERPKRDAAKKFLNGAEGPGGGKLDGRKSVHGVEGVGRGGGARKGGKGPDGMAGKRPAPGGPGGDGDKKRGKQSQDMNRADVPKVSVDTGIRRLDLAALKRYKKHFNLKNTTSGNKDDLQAAVIKHFASQLRADSGKTERSFLKFLKERKSSDKQD